MITNNLDLDLYPQVKYPQVKKEQVKNFISLQKDEIHLINYFHYLGFFAPANRNEKNPQKLNFIFDSKCRLDDVTTIYLEKSPAVLNDGFYFPNELDEKVFVILIKFLIKQLKNNFDNTYFLKTTLGEIQKEFLNNDINIAKNRIKKSLNILSGVKYRIQKKEINKVILDGYIGLLSDWFYNEKKDALFIDFSYTVKKIISNQDYNTNYYKIFYKFSTAARKFLMFILDKYSYLQLNNDGTNRYRIKESRDYLGEIIRSPLRNRKQKVDTVLKNLEKEQYIKKYIYNISTKYYYIYPTENLIKFIKKNNYYKSKRENNKESLINPFSPKNLEFIDKNNLNIKLNDKETNSIEKQPNSIELPNKKDFDYSNYKNSFLNKKEKAAAPNLMKFVKPLLPEQK